MSSLAGRTGAGARPPEPGPSRSDRLYALYTRMLCLLLAGYLLFDRAFAYLHIPGTPLFVAEVTLLVGALGALAGLGRVRMPDGHSDTGLVPLTLFLLWGLVVLLSDLGEYGIDAVRDSALCYYALFALFTYVAVVRSPDLPDRLVDRLTRLTPWLLSWLPIGLLLIPYEGAAPVVPDSGVSVLSHKAGNAAIAALLVLGCLWLFRGRRSPTGRAWCSIAALGVIGLAATQNRGGLLAVGAGVAVGLAFVHDRGRLVLRAVAVAVIGLGVATLLQPEGMIVGAQGREFSSQQLIANLTSLGSGESEGNLDGTVRGREELWTRILDKQVADGHLVDGSGFGPNLAAAVQVFDSGTDALRNPHNSHLDVLARTGLVGLVLWIALWVGWFARLVSGCRRLGDQGSWPRRQVGVLSLTVATAILVSTFFDPQLEGPQMAALLWTIFGLGLAVTRREPSPATDTGVVAARDGGRPGRVPDGGGR